MKYLIRCEQNGDQDQAETYEDAEKKAEDIINEAFYQEYDKPRCYIYTLSHEVLGKKSLTITINEVKEDK
jgi:hypothetical protein